MLHSFNIIGRWEVVSAVILQVDVTDPSAVVFTATSAFAQKDYVVQSSTNDGILLSGFLSGNTASISATGVDSGTLNVLDNTGTSTRQPLDQIAVNVGMVAANDVNFLGSVPDMTLKTTERAFTGSITHDLGGLIGLPTVGAGGNVIALDNELETIVGKYEVVPEPGRALLMGVSLLVVAVLRRSRWAASRDAV